MKITTARQPFRSLSDTAVFVADLAKGLSAGWNVEHRTDGTHKLPWVRVVPSEIAFTNLTSTTFTLCKYQVVDKTMVLVFDFTGTAGTATAISFTIPGQYRTRESTSAGTFAYSDAGTPGMGDPIAVEGRIDLYKNINAPAWTAGTARVQGTITFEVQ